MAWQDSQSKGQMLLDHGFEQMIHFQVTMALFQDF